MRAVLLSSLCLALAFVSTDAGASCFVTSQPEVDQDTGSGRFYVEADGPPFVGAFVYEEANGIPGLQRNDANVGDQSCGFPDRLLFTATAG